MIMNNHPANMLPLFWAQGEHSCVVGDTGTGKTYLISKLVQMREHVIVFRTKPDDISFPGFKRVTHADAIDDWRNPRVLLAPKYERQAYEGWHVLERVYKQGSWTIVIDEHWLAEKLGLRDQIERLLTQGRSLNVSVVIGMQRPVQVSRFVIAESTHVYAFQLEGRDAKTLAEATTDRIIGPATSLTGHDFVYFNRKKRIVAKGNARTIGRLITSYREYSAQKPLTTSTA